FLAHHKGVDRSARGVQDRRGGGVRAEGQSTDRVVVPVGRELAEQSSDERGRLVVQGGTAQVDVVVGFTPGRQGDASVDDGEVGDEVGESAARVLVDFGGGGHLAPLRRRVSCGGVAR